MISVEEEEKAKFQMSNNSQIKSDLCILKDEPKCHHKHFSIVKKLKKKLKKNRPVLKYLTLNSQLANFRYFVKPFRAVGGINLYKRRCKQTSLK